MELILMAIFLYVLPKGENEEIKVLPSVVLSSLKFESIFVDFIPLLTLYLFFIRQNPSKPI